MRQVDHLVNLVAFCRSQRSSKAAPASKKIAPTRRRLHLTAFATRASEIYPNMRRPHSKLKQVRDLGNHGLCSSPQPALALHSSVVALTTGRIKPGMRLGRSLPPLVNTMSYLLTRCSALFSFHPHYRIAQPWPLRYEGGLHTDAQERTRPGKVRSVSISRTVCWGFAKNTTRMIRSTCQMSVKLLVLLMLTCTDKTKRLTKCPFLLESSSRCLRPHQPSSSMGRQALPICGDLRRALCKR